MNIFTRIYNYWSVVSSAALSLYYGIGLIFQVCTSDHLFFALLEVDPFLALKAHKRHSRMSSIYVCSDEEMVSFVDLFSDFSFESLSRLEVNGLDDRAVGLIDRILKYFVLNKQQALDLLTLEHCGCSNAGNELVSIDVLILAFSNVKELTLDLRRRNNYGPDLHFQQQCMTALRLTTT